MIYPFLALTDKAWFDYLTSIASEGRVDEVNFWSPRAQRPMKQMRPGEPVFFRLKSPINAVAGYGFFAHFTILELDTAWSTFGIKNGDPNRQRFLQRIGGYRSSDLSAHSDNRKPLGCTILRDAVFWPQQRWIPWGEAEGWKPNIVQGRTEPDPSRASRLLGEIQLDAQLEPEDFASRFEPLDIDERELATASVHRREGQGAFRARILDAYGRKCAISGEKTEPVLDAAHVQPYLGPRSNHVQNGLLLSKEFHALFDHGLLTVTPDYRIRVSSQIKERWSNGRRFYSFDGQPLISVPTDSGQQPSRDALRWHNERIFVA